MRNELFHADRRTYITKLIERAYKTPNQKHNLTQIIKQTILVSRIQPRLYSLHLEH